MCTSLNCEITDLIHFMPLVFLCPLKSSENLWFSWGIEKDQWHKLTTTSDICTYSSCTYPCYLEQKRLMTMKMMMRWMKQHQKMKLVTIGPSTLLYLIRLLVLRFSPIIITHRDRPKPNEETIELQKGRYGKFFNEETNKQSIVNVMKR